MTTATIAPLAITGCGVVTPAGVGLAALAEGMTRGLPLDDRAPDDPELSGEDFPPLPVLALRDLPVEQYLGTRGVKSLDRTTRLALLASDRALADLDVPLTAADRNCTGVVLGTIGSMRSTTEFCRETLVREKPYLVRANRFPGTIMNYATGQIATWNSLRGVNATVNDGRVSGLSVFRYARNAIAHGHIRRAVVGATEELSAQMTWAWHLSGVLTLGVPVGEGAALFVVEPMESAAAAGRTPQAEVLACEVGSAGSGLRDALIACVRRAVRCSGLEPASVDTVCFGSTGIRGLEAAERDAVHRALGRLPDRQVTTAATIGQCSTAGGALQVAGLLAGWRARDDAGSVALVTAVTEEGYAGCLLIRRPAGSSTG